MPIQRFRTFEDARRALWLPSGDPTIWERLRRLAEFARVSQCSPGVRRFRSIGEAKAGKRITSR